MDTVQVSEIRTLLGRMQIDLSIVLHAMDTKILVGEINRPATSMEKKPRKKRTPKVKVEDSSPSCNLADKFLDSNPFYNKPKRGRKKKETVDILDAQGAGR